MGNNTSGNTLFKSRSNSAIIKTGYNLYTGCFRKTFKASWPYALAYAIVFSALGTTCVIQLPRLMLELLANITRMGDFISNNIILLLLLSGLAVAGAAAEILFYSCGISLLRRHKSQDSIPAPTGWLSFDGKTAWRTMKAALCNMLVALIPAIAFALFFHYRLRFMLTEPGSHVISLTVTAVAVIIVALLLLPVCFVSIKYVMCDGTGFWPLLAKDYKVGLSHIAGIFIVMLVCLIVILIVGLVILLPSNIIMTANLQANFGVAAYGDPLGMPDNMIAITAATFLIAGFFEAYIRMSALFPIYYMYGAIEAQEDERRRFRKNKETDNATQQYSTDETITVH